jgi:pyridoxal phosphate enzyme (YggS family)
MAQAYTKEQMQEAVARIRREIASAAARSGRREEDITLCAVCKTRDSDTVRLSAQLDVDIFGENHMQELVAHAHDGAFLGKAAHFIGHLQTNKIKKIVGLADVIQSVDSLKLLEAIDSEAARRNITQDILIEVNIGLEESKSGVLPESLPYLLEESAKRSHLRLRGLMAIPPAWCTGDERRRYFEQMRRLFESLRGQNYPNALPDTLSMGMSGSYIEAILEGATLVRVVTAIYGPRDYGNKV